MNRIMTVEYRIQTPVTVRRGNERRRSNNNNNKWRKRDDVTERRDALWEIFT